MKILNEMKLGMLLVMLASMLVFVAPVQADDPGDETGSEPPVTGDMPQ